MSSSYFNISCCSSSVPKPLSHSLSPSSLCYCNKRISIHEHISSTKLRAKFDKFDGQEDVEEAFQDNPLMESVQELTNDDEEGDSCLPSDLNGAVRQASEASATFVSSGGMRAIVELLIPQLQFLDDEGAQAELWGLARVFLDTLIEETSCQRVKAVFPDAGAAALLKYQWKDANFRFSSLGDRKPVESDDEIVVMVVPDYQMLEYVGKIASALSDDPPRPLIMWNPRLVSEDVGVGINVRRLRRDFLSTFTVVYSMRPFPSGAVFRSYPDLWKVFYDDKDRPNRYLLAKEQISRPTADELEIIFGAEEKGDKETSLIDQAASIFSSLNRFMRVISR
ncbi:hypothetical protein LIER_05325 [Lithospermum erythrorhizon]|uniref:DUF1995 domain-containing protein n=1 Tax=Lithospermum erythrorhizon TaxID=34254 RepID=A0AAV3P4X5_LITER